MSTRWRWDCSISGWLEVAWTGLARLPDPSELPDCDISALWPGGFISTLEMRRRDLARGQVSVRTELALIEGEPHTPSRRRSRSWTSPNA